MSVDSDDQNLNGNQHVDVDEDLLVNIERPYCKDTRTTLSIDKNGNNTRRSDNLNNNINSSSFCVDANNGNDNGNEKEKMKSAVSRLQALAMSDDEDFGEFFSVIWVFSLKLAR